MTSETIVTSLPVCSDIETVSRETAHIGVMDTSSVDYSLKTHVPPAVTPTKDDSHLSSKKDAIEDKDPVPKDIDSLQLSVSSTVGDDCSERNSNVNSCSSSTVDAIDTVMAIGDMTTTQVLVEEVGQYPSSPSSMPGISPQQQQRVAMMHPNSRLECKICFESDNDKCHLCICAQSHFLCVTCGKQYLSSQIESGTYPVKCPFHECRRLILDEAIERYLRTEEGDNNEELWKEFSRLASLASSTKYCRKCQEPKHSGRCSPNNKRFVVSVRRNGYKCCPKCHRWIEKNGGCNGMTCVCGTTFCYLCGQQACNCRKTGMRRKCVIM